MVGWHNDGLGWGGWVLMMVAMIAFWSVVVIATVAVFRGTQRSGRPSADRRDPVQILDERFARGEVDEEEYHAGIRVLRSSVH